MLRARAGWAMRLGGGALAGALSLSCGGEDQRTTPVVRDGIASEVGAGSSETVSSNSSPAEATAAPELQTLECVAGLAPRRPDPAVPAQVQGTTEIRIDECDAAGNLIEYGCELTQFCEQLGPNPCQSTVATGALRAQAIDCDGRCAFGACLATCPEQGDEVNVLEIGSAGALLSNSADPRPYRCTLLGPSFDGFDCMNVRAGATGYLSSLGLRGECTGGELGNIGVCFDGDCAGTGQDCTYSCRFEP